MRNLAAFIYFMGKSICPVDLRLSKSDMISSISCSSVGLRTIDDKHLLPRCVSKSELLLGEADMLFVRTVMKNLFIASQM